MSHLCTKPPDVSHLTQSKNQNPYNNLPDLNMISFPPSPSLTSLISSPTAQHLIHCSPATAASFLFPGHTRPWTPCTCSSPRYICCCLIHISAQMSVSVSPSLTTGFKISHQHLQLSFKPALFFSTAFSSPNILQRGSVASWLREQTLKTDCLGLYPNTVTFNM